MTNWKHLEDFIFSKGSILKNTISKARQWVCMCPLYFLSLHFSIEPFYICCISKSLKIIRGVPKNLNIIYVVYQ